MIDFKLDKNEKKFQKDILIKKGLKHYSNKCGVLESEVDELKFYKEEIGKTLEYREENIRLKKINEKLKEEVHKLKSNVQTKLTKGIKNTLIIEANIKYQECFNELVKVRALLNDK